MSKVLKKMNDKADLQGCRLTGHPSLDKLLSSEAEIKQTMWDMLHECLEDLSDDGSPKADEVGGWLGELLEMDKDLLLLSLDLDDKMADGLTRFLTDNPDATCKEIDDCATQIEGFEHLRKSTQH